MNLFSFFKRKPSVIDDEVFGRLELRKTGSTYTPWHGKKRLLTAQREIEYIVEAVERNLPTEKQRQFFKEFEKNYSYLEEKWVMALNKITKPSYLQEFDFSKDIRKVTLSIPNEPGGPFEWDVSLEIDREDLSFPLIDIDMEEWEIVNITIEEDE